jgi:hypothetical protein
VDGEIFGNFSKGNPSLKLYSQNRESYEKTSKVGSPIIRRLLVESFLIFKV